MKIALLLALATSACITDPADESESAVESAETRDPRVPRYPGLKTARIDMQLANSLLALRLTGTRLSFDATNTAPGIHRPGDDYRNCTRDDAGYADMKAECYGIVVGRFQCLRQAAQDWASSEVCTTVPIYHHSYLAFTDQLKASYPSLQDYLFDVDTFRSYTWTGGVDITLNRINTTIDSGNTFVFAAPNYALDPTGVKALAGISIRASSGSPTAYCRHTAYLLWCPDIQLTNMQFSLRLHLRPSAADATRIGFGGIDTVFTFDRNINNTPDWLVDAFWDIDKRIRDRTEARVRDALLDPGRHDALERAIDEVMTLVARASTPGFTDFGVIDEINYYGGDLYIHYQ